MSDDLIKRLTAWGESAMLSKHFMGTVSAKERCGATWLVAPLSSLTRSWRMKSHTATGGLLTTRTGDEMMWQPIETAPKDGAVIVWGRYWSDEQGWMLEPKIARWDASAFGGSWVVDHRYPFSVRPTHWMPLPPPPEVTP